MIFKAVKVGVLSVGGLLLAGGLVFGTDLGSYVRSSCRNVRVAVKENIPTEFEIRRARDLLDEIGPEMQNNVHAIAEQEVEVAGLHKDIDQSRIALVEEKQRVGKLRDSLNTSQVSFTFGDFTYTRGQLTQELSRRFNHLREAEQAMTSKQQLLEARQKSLIAAQEAFENARAKRAALEAQIEGLEAQYRLIQTASASSNSPAMIDSTKLAQATKVVGDIRRQLDVAEHVLAHEAKFTQPMQLDVIDEKDLLNQVDAHLSGDPAASATAAATH